MISARVLRTSALMSCLVAAAVLQLRPSAAQDAPHRVILQQCEKKLARDGLQELLASGGLAKGGVGGSLAVGSYKAYKLSNTLQQKDVRAFLTEHGLRDPSTIRKFAPIIKTLVRGKYFRRSALMGIVVGGVVFFTEASHALTPSSSEPHAPKIASDEKVAQLTELVKREFGSKDKLALWFAEFSIARYDGDRSGDFIVFFTLQTCSDERNATVTPTRIEEAKQPDPATKACLLEHTMLECLFGQRQVIDTLKNVLSPIRVENDEISWDMNEFDGD